MAVTIMPLKFGLRHRLTSQFYDNVAKPHWADFSAELNGNIHIGRKVSQHQALGSAGASMPGIPGLTRFVQIWMELHHKKQQSAKLGNSPTIPSAEAFKYGRGAH